MREMVLNHASLVADNRYVATEWLIGLSKGISAIRSDGIVTSPMRAGKYFYEIQCTVDATLLDLTIEMLSTPSIEEAQLLMELDSKSLALPLNDANQDVTEEDTELRLMTPFDPPLSMADAGPLLYCAVNQGTALGFPSSSTWDRDEIEVRFERVTADVSAITKLVDNVTRPEHAEAICERHRANLRDIANFDELWERRASAFPNLVFGSDIRRQLESVNPRHLSSIIRCLRHLEDASRAWQLQGGAMPSWSINVRNESDSVKQNRRLNKRRLFRTQSGNKEFFMWHADYDDGGRVHLRFDAETKKVEIGYIGKHLPL